jgi:hypothetical protein
MVSVPLPRNSQVLETAAPSAFSFVNPVKMGDPFQYVVKSVLLGYRSKETATRAVTASCNRLIAWSCTAPIDPLHSEISARLLTQVSPSR